MHSSGLINTNAFQSCVWWAIYDVTKEKRGGILTLFNTFNDILDKSPHIKVIERNFFLSSRKIENCSIS